MADVVTICNLALGRLGTTRIMSLDEASQPARYCKLFYENTRDEVLRSHPWSFAKARQTLSLLSTTPSFGWANQFQLPADCLRPIQVNEWEQDEAPDNWLIEGNRLLTDASTVDLLYVRRVTDSTLFDSIFVKALSVKLAAEICTPLTGSREQGNAFQAEFQNILAPLAKRIDGGQGQDKRKLPWVESDLVKSRFGSQGEF